MTATHFPAALSLQGLGEMLGPRQGREPGPSLPPTACGMRRPWPCGPCGVKGHVSLNRLCPVARSGPHGARSHGSLPEAHPFAWVPTALAPYSPTSQGPPRGPSW